MSFLKDFDLDVLSNVAGLLFFSACCIALAQLLKTFHRQRDCPGSRYRSLKMILFGYIVFFAIVVLCMTVASVIVAPTSSSDEEDATAMTDMLEAVLSALFALSFLFISITFFIVFFMLKDAWSYLKIVTPFCLFHRPCFCGSCCSTHLVLCVNLHLQTSYWLPVCCSVL